MSQLNHKFSNKKLETSISIIKKNCYADTYSALVNYKPFFRKCELRYQPLKSYATCTKNVNYYN